MIEQAMAELLRELKYDSPEIYQAFLNELHLTENKNQEEANEK